MSATEQHRLDTWWTFWSQLQPVSTSKNAKQKKPVLIPAYDFNTVENFWALYNSLRTPKDVAQGVRLDFIFMRTQLRDDVQEPVLPLEGIPIAPKEETETPAEGEAPMEPVLEENDEPLKPSQLQVVQDSRFVRVAPEWEDLSNIGGGEYRFTADSDLATTQKQWEAILLSILGGSFPLADEIVGIWLALGRKNTSTISLWKRAAKEGRDDAENQKIIAKALFDIMAAEESPIAELSYTLHKDSIVSAQAPPHIWVDPVKTTWTAADFEAKE